MKTITIVCAFGAIQAFGGNLLVNPNFEAGKAGWELPRENYSVTAGAGYLGSTGLVWTCSDPNKYSFPVQHRPAEPGVGYRVSALVKVDELKGGAKPNVGFEWTSKAGKWMAGCYGRPVDDNGILKDGWVRYVGVSQAMPADVGRLGVVCCVSRGGTGRVRFDDVTLERVELKRVSSLTTDAYRDRAVSGRVRFLAHLIAFPKSNRAELSYENAAGARVTVPATELLTDRALFDLDVASFRKGTQTVRAALIESATGRTLGTADCSFTREDAPARRRITFDAQCRMYVDGKKFFPLGLYTSALSEKSYAEYRRGPFNFAVQYGALTTKALDEWQKIGVLVAADVRNLIYGYDYSAKSKFKTFEQSKAAVREAVAKFASHPAFAMWYMNDEAPVQFVKNNTDVHRYFHEIDPDHPTLTCLCVPKTAVDFLPSYDIMLHDCYPIGNHVGKNMTERVTRQMREIEANMSGMRPLWFAPQTFDWSWYYKGDSLARCDQARLRMPTREEIANMTWQSIACGANGIVSYCFHSLRNKLQGEAYEKAWGDVCGVAREVKKMEDVLLADPLTLVPQTLPTYLDVRAWHHEGRNWYLVVNALREPMKATIRLNVPAKSIETSLGEGVKLSSDGQSLEVNLPALGYAFVGSR